MFGQKARKTIQHRFESEVHIGLLLIIFVLVFVAFWSNLVIYRAKTRLTEQWTGRLESISLPIHRQLSHFFPGVVPDSAIATACNRHNLSNLYVIATGPEDNSDVSKRKWLTQVAGTVPPSKIADLAHQLFTSEEGALTKQSDDTYALIVPGDQSPGYPYMILTASIPELAYFDRASSWILTLTALAMVFIGGLYFYLSQYIFRPFRKIRIEAERAGRPIPDATNEAEAVVVEYQKIIDDLHANQQELLRLNAEIKRRAESLEQFNEYILKSTQSGVITIDMQGRILAINDAALKLVDGDAPLALPVAYQQVLPATHSLTSVIANTLQTAIEPAYQEMSWPGKTVGVSLSFVRNAQSKRVGLWVLLFDLTETAGLRKELEDRRRLAALGEMAGGLAHQLRNSIGAISGYARLLRKKVAESAESTSQADTLLDETRQADQLIKRFLSFSRPLECELIDYSISELVREIVEGMKIRPDFNRTDLKWSDDSVTDVRGLIDPLLFKQVLTNLIENASLSYRDRTGMVEIAVFDTIEGVTIEIRDRGCGIPPDKIDNVFTPFYSSRPDGTGLGLPLAARIVEMHRGSLSLSPRDGGGTVATVKLPLRHGEARVDVTSDIASLR